MSISCRKADIFREFFAKIYRLKIEQFDRRTCRPIERSRQTSLVFAIAAVNEIHVATVIFDLNSQVLSLTLTTTHVKMF